MVEWPNGGMKFPKQDIRSPYDFAADRQARPPGGLRGPHGHQLGSRRAPRARSSASSTSGFDRVYLHNVGRNQREWIEVFGREVLPKLAA